VAANSWDHSYAIVGSVVRVIARGDDDRIKQAVTDLLLQPS
jgi:hypothetical protein